MAAQGLAQGLATKLNHDQLANFRDDDLQLLVKRRYANLAALEAAREEDLREAGLEIALIRILQQAGVVGEWDGDVLLPTALENLEEALDRSE